MGYLIRNDYLRQIQNVQLTQILTGNPSALSAAEAAAEAEARSYLVQKYLIDQELAPLNAYNPTVQYYAGTRVYLDGAQYVSTNSYVVGNIVLNSGNIYICIVNTTGTFAPSSWTLLGAQYDLYYGAYPVPLFNLYAQYKAGDQVFYNGRKYKALQNSIIPTSSIQYGEISNIPYPNVYPGNTSYWQDLGAYVIPIANNINNATYWTKGDNRDQQLLMYIIDICLYHLHSRIAPNVIPELRQNRYDDAIGWLKMAGKGSVTAAIPRTQPRSGNRIRFGGPIKQNNSY